MSATQTVSACTQNEINTETAAPPRRALSEAQLAARRANAQKSTGPRSPEGKARSRLNSLRHGLRAALPVALPGEDAEALEERRAAWVEDLRPESLVELHLVDAAVTASWMLDRLQRAEDAALAGQIQRLDDDHDIREAAEVERLADSLAERPAAAVAALQTSIGGCRFLLERWQALAEALEAGLAWEPDQLALALTLLGRRPTDFLDDPTSLRLVQANLAYGWQTYRDEPEPLTLLLRGFAPATMLPQRFARRVARLAAAMPDQQTGYETLQTLCYETIAALEGRLALLGARAESDRALALARALIDETPAGALRQRYFGLHQRALRSSLNDLLRLRRERRAAASFDEADTLEEDGAVEVSGTLADHAAGTLADHAAHEADAAHHPAAPTEPKTPAPTEPKAPPAHPAPPQETGTGSGRRRPEPVPLSGDVAQSPTVTAAPSEPKAPRANSAPSQETETGSDRLRPVPAPLSGTQSSTDAARAEQTEA